MKRNIILGLILLIPFITSFILNAPSLAIPNESEQATPIKIGIFLPVAAGLNYYGVWARQGFELGLIYATGGTNATADGRPYELHYYDTLGDAVTIASKVQSAIETDGIDIIYGGVSSAVAANMIPVTKLYQRLYFVGPAVDSEITGSLFDKHTFRIARNSYHDAKAGIYHSMEVLGCKNIAFLAADYSFGYSGVGAMAQEVARRGGKVIQIEYAPFTLTPTAGYFTPYLQRLKDTVTNGTRIDMLHIIWPGTYIELFNNVFNLDLFNYMNVSGVAIDILSMNLLEDALTPPATIIGGQGLCVYGYKLPNNSVNDWMVQQHITRNIKPNAMFGLQYKVPELFTAEAFGTAQFLVNVTNTVSNLQIDNMIAHLEGLNITTPKGPTYLRPNDHQGLAEMYIADIVNDTDSSSETYNEVIAVLNQTIPASEVAPPITTDYTPYPETVLSTVISGTTIYFTTGATTIITTILRTSGFGLVVALFGSSMLIYLKKRKK